MSRIELELCDIAREQTEAIVNAANPHLSNGSGVAGAIREVAGADFQAECERLIAERGPLEVGTDAAVTSAGRLPCRHVVHVVGPVWGQQGETASAELLDAAHRAALAAAEEIGAASVSFPAISTGVFGYPPEKAAPVAISAVQGALAEHPGIELVRFCLFSEEDLKTYARAAAELG